jgi:DNA-binding response OmpR family regulator
MTVTSSLPRIGAVLLLEDDALISLDTEEILLSLGANSVHVAHNLDQAESIVAVEKLDVAVLDLVIGSGRSEALARRLVGQSLPVIFASGHDDVGEIAEGLERVPMVRKPYSAQSLQGALLAALARREPG